MDGVQDANEDGMANITINLLNAGSAVLDTTVTGPNGEYLFSGLDPDGSYIVEVVSGVPTGLNQTYDEGGALDNRTGLIAGLTPGEEHLTADFGYGPLANTGSIGDRIWIDANGDGQQSLGEPGLSGVMVQITPPPDVVIGGGAPGAPTTVITGIDGRYLVTNLDVDLTTQRLT